MNAPVSFFFSHFFNNYLSVFPKQYFQKKNVVENFFPEKQQIEIEKLPSTDNRSYHINSDKILRTLGFKAKRSLEEAVKDLCLSFKKGLINKSFENDLYYNVRRLKNIQAK